jgi:methionyl-tRNA synthetase
MDKVAFSDFAKLDIRIGTVIKAEVPEWSHWVMKLTVDFASGAKSSKNRSSRRVRTEPESREVRSGGEEEIGERTIFAGIIHFYKPEGLVGKQMPFVVNLEPKKIGPEGDVSEGMMLAASPVQDPPIVINEESIDEKPVLFLLTEKVPNGTKVR